MIRLHRTPKPEKLKEKEVELTELFINQNKDVWNKSYIRKNLLLMSNSKCSYCETKLLEESKYMTVEHFHPKSDYPYEVVDWNNLLPSCSRCNSNKGNHNTYNKPIINPVKENPTDYFYLNNYRFKSKDTSADSKARITINVLGLNDSIEIVSTRFKLGEKMCEKIDDLYHLSTEYLNDNVFDVAKKNRIIRGIKNVLNHAQPKAEYSGTMATIILNYGEYEQLKNILEHLNFWNDELEQLHNTAYKLKFDTTI